MRWWFRINRQNNIARELRAHLQLEAAEQQDRGNLTEDEARYAARRTLGNLTQLMEDTQAVWTQGWLEDLISDLRFAVRAFSRKLGMTALNRSNSRARHGREHSDFQFGQWILRNKRGRSERAR